MSKNSGVDFRIEKDFLGEVQVPKDAYYGIFTVRASKNFQISSSRPSRTFIKMLASIKKSAAEANLELGLLEKTIAKAIILACDEIIEGKFDDQFILDSYTAGAGTPFNMNMNEVIANRAEEILGGQKGKYSLVHPNNHANMSQSSNDVIPAAIRLTLIFESKELLEEAKKLSLSLRKKAKEYSKVVKIGRTHLMDAVPLTVKDELSSYYSQIDKNIYEINFAINQLREVNLGATAIGSGINTAAHYRYLVVKYLQKNTHLALKKGKNFFRLTSFSSDFLFYSSSLCSYALTLHKIANDFKLLSSGPNTSISEYILPEVEPGSSIMPGKVNPSIPECVEMISNKVFGNHLSVLFASAGGQLQLNVQTPLILKSLEESVLLLSNSSKMFNSFCVSGLKLNLEKIQKNLEASLILVTALSPYFGYQKSSDLVKEAQQQNKSLKEILLEKNLLSKSEIDKILNPLKLTKPNLKPK
jgi:aspartate ammonia-lyase